MHMERSQFFCGAIFLTSCLQLHNLTNLRCFKAAFSAEVNLWWLHQNGMNFCCREVHGNNPHLPCSLVTSVKVPNNIMGLIASVILNKM